MHILTKTLETSYINTHIYCVSRNGRCYRVTFNSPKFSSDESI